MGRFFKLKQGPRFFTCTRRVASVKTKECVRGRVRLYVHDYMHCMHDGAMAGREQFFVASFGPIGRRVPAGGWAVGRLVGRCSWAGLGYLLASVGWVGTQ